MCKIQDNQIFVLPESFTQLGNLEELNLYQKLHNACKEMKTMHKFAVIPLDGLQPYEDMLATQYTTWEKVKNGAAPVLFLLEHKPVITLGRRTDDTHVLLQPEEYVKKGIDLVRVQRGGSATYHGPGQLVGYVICKVSQLGGTHKLVERVLNLVVAAIEAQGIACKASTENPGVWTTDEHPRKIAQVGMQIKEGYSLHGFAINVDMALTGFNYIVPCGLTEPVSTLSLEKGETVTIEQVKQWIQLHVHKYLN